MLGKTLISMLLQLFTVPTVVSHVSLFTQFILFRATQPVRARIEKTSVAQALMETADTRAGRDPHHCSRAADRDLLAMHGRIGLCGHARHRLPEPQVGRAGFHAAVPQGIDMHHRHIKRQRALLQRMGAADSLGKVVR